PGADLTLVDVVDEALDDAEYFCRALGARPRRAHEPPAGEAYDLILAVNVLAETAAPLEGLLTERGHLVVLEPALRTTTRRLMEWRDGLVARGYRIAAPCLGPRTCPMLEHEDLWCHMDVAWPRPATVAEIDRRLGFSKESLKYSYLVVTRKGATMADRGGTHRVVSNLHREKGKAWAWLCGSRGPLCRTEVLTRHRSEATAAFFHAERGHVLRLQAEGASVRSEGPVERVLY
ncbi:MAG TPA: small ribosomal subunit Rsm22 family protein, partial [Planctomycetota bacterium]|nr:small ribosomal subunit Rsm22 family protein [Planctomycetota bacterium]